MIALWMVTATVVGLIATAAAAAAERALIALKRPARFAWIAAMAFTVAWPAIALLRARLHRGASALEAAPITYGLQRATSYLTHASAASIIARLDVVLITAWIAMSLLLIARLVRMRRMLAGRARTWRAHHVDGIDVRLAPDIGPAVVGVRAMEVVLPEWALDLNPSLRSLVLRHEDEHRRARDPHLLLLAATLPVLAPWNPALWWQAERLRLAVELDCDARVLRADPRPDSYGILLLAIAQRRTAGLATIAPSLTKSPSHLEQRIDAMKPTAWSSSKLRILIFAGIAAGAVAAACAVDAPVAPSAARETPRLGLALRAAEREQSGDSSGWIEKNSVHVRIANGVDSIIDVTTRYVPSVRVEPDEAERETRGFANRRTDINAAEQRDGRAPGAIARNKNNVENEIDGCRGRHR